MKFDIVTIFPEFFSGTLDYGIVRRARESGVIDVRIHDLREFTHDRHRTVDDRPFGGGEGMVLKPEPLFEAVEMRNFNRERYTDLPMDGGDAMELIMSLVAKGAHAPVAAYAPVCKYLLRVNTPASLGQAFVPDR